MPPARSKESQVGDLESQIDDLYKQPLYAFVEGRNALAGRRRFGGDKEGAARVKALAKPSASAWAVNQLHWNARPELLAFIDTARAVREKQQKGAPADELREASRRRREALLAVTKLAESLLLEAGHGAPPSMMRRVTGTLEALAFRLASGEKLALGRLSEDLEPPGLEALQGLAPIAPAQKTKAAAASDRSDVEPSMARAESAAARSRRRAEEAAAEAETARERLAAAQAELAEAQRRLRRAEERVDKGKAALAEAEQAAERAAAEREAAEQALEGSRQGQTAE
jgi:hypothetical protein